MTGKTWSSNVEMTGYTQLPIDLAVLEKVFLGSGVNRDKLRVECSYIPGFIDAEMARSTDDFGWFAAVRFNVPGGEVAILLPYIDGNKSDGYALQRHMAVMSKGEIKLSGAEKVVNSITTVIANLNNFDKDELATLLRQSERRQVETQVEETIKKVQRPEEIQELQPWVIKAAGGKVPEKEVRVQ